MATDIEVVRGQPTAEELAAVIVVLAARARPSRPEGTAPRPSLWAARSRQMRPAVVPGAGAWRASGLPG